MFWLSDVCIPPQWRRRVTQMNGRKTVTGGGRVPRSYHLKRGDPAARMCTKHAVVISGAVLVTVEMGPRTTAMTLIRINQRRADDESSKLIR